MSPRTWLPLLLPLAFVPRPDEVTFHAAEGAELVRAFTAEIELELDDLSVTLDGNDHTFGEPEISITAESTFVVRDVYGPLGDGRPERLTRAFETLAGVKVQSATTPDGEGGDEETTSSSELEGRRVAFAWDGDEEDFRATFDDDGEDDRDLLEGLVEDMDLRAFLPADDVEQGDSWEIDAAAFLLVHSPGGVDLIDDDGEDESTDELDEMLDENLDGDLTGTYRGTRDEGGRRVAVIELAVDLETRGEQTIDREGSEALRSLSLTFELEGELLWDLEAGHLHALDLSGSLGWRDEEQSVFEGPGGEEFEVVQTMELSGDYRIAASVER